MPRKRKKNGIKSEISSSISSPVKAGEGRKTRDRKTYVFSPIKGSITQSKQWSRNEGWTP